MGLWIKNNSETSCFARRQDVYLVQLGVEFICFDLLFIGNDLQGSRSRFCPIFVRLRPMLRDFDKYFYCSICPYRLTWVSIKKVTTELKISPFSLLCSMSKFKQISDQFIQAINFLHIILTITVHSVGNFPKTPLVLSPSKHPSKE